MWFLDFPSLVLIVAAGLQLGLQAIFGWNAVGALVGDGERFMFMAMGLSAAWQLLRQVFH